MPKKNPPTKITITIEKEQLDWLEKNKYNLSALVRTYLKEFIPSLEKTKKGIVIPAFIKAPNDEALKEKLRKNPKFRHLVKDD